jgi:hypothetical protein
VTSSGKKWTCQFERGLRKIHTSQWSANDEMKIQEKSTRKELQPKLAQNNGNNLQRLARKSVCPLVATFDQAQKVTVAHESRLAVWKNKSYGFNKIQLVLAIIMIKITVVIDLPQTEYLAIIALTRSMSSDSLTGPIAANAV